MLRALIYKSTGTWYKAKTAEGNMLNCRIKGKFKADKEITSTNPIAVGDSVRLQIEDDDATIVEIEKRKNYIIRQSPHNKHQKHIVAANLDQSMIVATIKNPRTSTGFIDRFLVSCEAYHIAAILVFNKADTYDDEDLKYYQYLKTLYEQIGYPVFLISAIEQEGLSQIMDVCKDKISLISGHSGVGKSTLLSVFLPDKDITTQSVSAWSGKGMHTTTYAEMYDLPMGGQIIDTPGIRELGIINMKRDELSGYFPEMKRLLSACKFNNCSHHHEPDCAIIDAVKKQIISEERYINYLKIYDSIQDKKY
ncbi:MAG: ribosome small subunit-dependent GTPase A [Chitinophagaceae bacterium]